LEGGETLQYYVVVLRRASPVDTSFSHEWLKQHLDGIAVSENGSGGLQRSVSKQVQLLEGEA